MTSTVRSLRQRLFLVVLLPLVFMACVLGFWRYTAALETADQLFDRSLLASALAISRDVSKSGGDALTPWTRDLIRDAAGEEVFYHVSGPAGSYITGYAYPPVAPKSLAYQPDQPVFFKGLYRDDAVRVIRLTEHAFTEYLSGDSTVTVWQRQSARERFSRQLAFRAMALIGALLATLVVVVWFGVQIGLRPLTNLQDAIAARSADDLSTIRRPVPAEVQGIVATLNRLFSQVVASLDAHQAFISNAAHQLRNPAASVLSMAETVRDAKDDVERAQRVEELISAAHASSRVTDQLLSLDRLQQGSLLISSERFDLAELSKQVCAELAASVLSKGIDFEFKAQSNSLFVYADAVLVSEVVKNLVDNALKHGGADLTSIVVEADYFDNQACIIVSNDGVKLAPNDQEKAFSRFGQLEPSNGSGLGLAIALSVAQSHNGALVVEPVERGTRIKFSLPSVG